MLNKSKQRNNKKLITVATASVLSLLIIAQVIVSAGIHVFAAGPEPEENFLFDTDSQTILEYYGEEPDLYIPDEIGGVSVLGIGPNAFSGAGLTSVRLPAGLADIGDSAFADNALTSVSLPAGVLSVGAGAFAYNQISSLSLNDGLGYIGEYAFRQNRLTGVSLPLSLTVIPTGAFMSNRLTEDGIDFSNITDFGDRAFMNNRFTQADIPAGAIYGHEVFADNGCYVVIYGGNPSAHTYSLPSAFGEIVEPTSLIIKYQDKSGGTLLPDTTVTSSLTVQAAGTEYIVSLNSLYTFTAPEIEGYAVISDANGDEVKTVVVGANVVGGQNVVVVKYVNENQPPYFTGLTPLTVLLSGTVDLMDGVHAYDMNDDEIPSGNITVTTPVGFGTAAPATFTVRYDVTDSKGRTTTEYRKVRVSDDPMNAEIADGWIYNDFTYDTGDRSIVTGLSTEGIIKAATNKGLCLPDVYPGGVTPIKIRVIADDAFSNSGVGYGFTGVSFDGLTALEEIGASAFYNNPIAELDLSMCKALTDIYPDAFYQASITELDLSGLSSLKRLSGFRECENLTTVNFGGNKSIEEIYNGAFTDCKAITALDFAGCTALAEIYYDNSIYGSAYSGIGGPFGNLTALRSINFQGSGIKEIYSANGADFPFTNSPLVTELDFSGTGIQVIAGKSGGNGPFPGFSGLLKADFSNSDLREFYTMGGVGFYNAPSLQIVDFSNSKLEVLYSYGGTLFGGSSNAALTTIDFTGCTSLREVYNYGGGVFDYLTALKRLDFTDCSNLEKVFNYGSGLFAGCTSLEEVTFKGSGLKEFYNSGSTMFYGCTSLKSLDFSDCARLERVYTRSSAIVPTLPNFTKMDFSNSGVIEIFTMADAVLYGENVTTLGFTGCSRLKRLFSGGGWAFNNMNKLTKLDFAGCTSLEEIFTPSGGVFYLPAATEINFSDCSSLKRIWDAGNHVMWIPRVKELDFSHCTALEELFNTGSSLFYTEDLEKVNLNGCVSLKRIWSGGSNNIFGTNNKLKGLDFSGCPNLESIKAYGGSPLSNYAQLEKISFRGLTKLKDVSGYFGVLDCSSLPELAYPRSVLYSEPFNWTNWWEGINFSTCQPIFDSNPKLKEVDITGCVNLERFGGFDNCPLITSFDLSPLVNLKELPYRAFRNCPITSIDLSHNTELRVIEPLAFAGTGVTSLDLRANTKLQAIYYDAFDKIPDGATVYLPDSVTQLGSVPDEADAIAFAPYNYANIADTQPFGPAKIVMAQIEHTSLTDRINVAEAYYGIGNATTVLINKAGYYAVDAYELGTGKLISKNIVTVPFEDSMVGASITINTPNFPPYTAAQPSQTVTLAAGANRLDYYYTMSNITTAGITLATVGNKNGANPVAFFIGNTNPSLDTGRMNFKLDFTLSGQTLPAGSEIIIPLTDPLIDLNKVEFQQSIYGITNSYVDKVKREIHFEISDSISAVSFSLTIYLDFISGNTPHMHEAGIVAYLVEGGSGNLLATSDLTDPAILRGKCHHYSNYLYVNGSGNSAWDQDAFLFYGVHVAGSDNNGDGVIDAGTEKRISFQSNLTSYSYSGFIRNVNRTCKLQIPTYLDASNTTRLAKVWYASGYDSSIGSYIYTEITPADWGTFIQPYSGGYFTVSADGTALLGDNNYITVYFTFPNAKIGQTVYVPYERFETPQQNKSDDEQTLIDTGDLMFYQKTTAYFSLGNEIQGDFFNYFSDRNGNLSNEGDYNVMDHEILDVLSRKQAVLPWTAVVAGKKDLFVRDPVFFQTDLDSRMLFYGVRNPGYATHPMTVTAYDASDTVIFSETTSDQTLVFPTELQAQIKRVEVSLPGVVIPSNGNYVISFLTKLKDPESISFSTASSGAGIYFYSRSWAEAKVAASAITEETGNIVSGSLSAAYWMRPFEEQLSAGHQHGADTPGTLMPGKSYSYNTIISGYKDPDSEWGGFVYADVIPVGVEVTGVTLSEAFRACPGAKAEIITDYNGSGRTVVLFTADRMNITSASINLNTFYYSLQLGNIQVKVVDAPSGSIINEVVARVERIDIPEEVVKYGSEVSDEYKINGPGGGVVSRSYLSAPNDAAKMVYQNTFVHAEGTDWTTSGITIPRGSSFEYKISLVNAGVDDIDGAVVYQLFPFIGDNYIDKKSGVLVPRNSEFTVVLTQAVTLPGWDVYYTTDQNPENTAAFLQNTANWKTASQLGGNFSSVTGIKLVAQGPVEKDTRMDVIMKMMVPSSALPGQVAVTSSSRNDENLYVIPANPAETPGVFIKIAEPAGSVEFVKTGDGGAVLPGATFRLYNDKNVFLASAISSNPGGVVRFDGLPAGTYQIREYAAPSTYQLSEEVIDFTLTTDSIEETPVKNLGTFENELIPPPPPVGSFKMVKSSIPGHTLSGITFRLTGVTGDAVGKVFTKTTGAGGMLQIFSIPTGDYRLEEISGYGNLEPIAPRIISIEQDKTTDIGEVLNPTAQLTVIKIGILDEATQKASDDKLTATVGKKLAGVTFKITSTEDTAFVSQTLTTGTSGTIIFTGLKLNTVYTVTETARTGEALKFDPRNDAYEVKIDSDGIVWITPIKDETRGSQYAKANLIVGNNAQEIDFHAILSKVDKAGGDGNPVPGAKFTINNSSAATTDPAKTFVVGESGQMDISLEFLESIFGKPLPSETFYVTEIEPPAGYYIPVSAKTWIFNISDGYIENEMVNPPSSLEITKYAKVAKTVYECVQNLGLTEILSRISESTKYSDLKSADRDAIAAAAESAGLILKIEDGQATLRDALAGARLRLYEVDTDVTIIDGVTGSDGKLDTSGVKLEANKTYALRELSAPTGYLVNPVIQVFKIDNLKMSSGFTGKVSLTVDDLPLTGEIYVTKLSDPDYQIIPGVTFNLYDEDMRLMDTQTTNENGLAVFRNRTGGIYWLVETAMEGPAADIFEVDSTPMQVDFSGTDTTKYVIVYNERIEKLSDLFIKKTDEDGNTMSNVKFALMHKTVGEFGEAVWENYAPTWRLPLSHTNIKGELTFKGLPAGTYRIVEVDRDILVYGDPIFTPVQGSFEGDGDIFTVTGDVSSEVRVNVVNPYIVVAPEVIEKVNFVDAYKLLSNNEVFEVETTISFGNQFRKFVDPVITITLDDIASATSAPVVITDHLGIPVDDAVVSVTDNTVVITLPKRGGSYSYLDDEEFTVTFMAKINDGVTDADLTSYADGIVSTAVFTGSPQISAQDDALAIPIVAPTVEMFVFDKYIYGMKSQDEKLEWNIVVPFGTDTAGWDKAVVTTTLLSTLKKEGVTEVTCNGVPVSPSLYSADFNETTGLLTVVFNKQLNPLDANDNGFGYLSGQTYVVTFYTTLIDGVTEEQLAEYRTTGIILESKLEYSESGQPVGSNKAKAIIPAARIEEPTNPTTSGSSGSGPKTGDDFNTAIWLSIAALALLAVLALAAVSRRRRFASPGDKSDA